MTARRPRAAGPLLGTFAALAVVHLAALLGDVTAVAQLTKPALMPVLAGYALARGGPPLLAGALLFGCGGDTLLQIGGDTVFLLGMGSFAAGHVCYLVLFARHGTPVAGRPSRTVALAAGYGVLLAGTVALLWPDLPPELRIPVAGYSLLLTTMAFGSLRAGPRAALGGLLFLLSDTLIASGIAHWPQLPAPQFWIMLTYAAAQFALADCVLRAAADSQEGRAANHPALR
ncbi:lysoplasmalogenase [Streptomyces piniterrae]|uniref:Lysoplasmalogenase n=1 Tax=Streptomyces piniterrae TaxID=2571125 RepID=A0A4U0NBA6_9ACTN|nr:lysoplasmalogenase [Streptomyces piniterrae]TJZ51189.1 lysoplasmalogenase [Streptomyces piniterrae]